MTVVVLWIVPLLLLVGGLVGLFCTQSGSAARVALALYVSLGYLTRHGFRLPDRLFRKWQSWLQQDSLRFLPITRLTPSVFVPAMDWKRPQVILAGPHGVLCLALLRSVLLPQSREKRMVLVASSMLSLTWVSVGMRLIGLEGILPTNHREIQTEMSGKRRRDLLVIPGGFVETNTGNQHYATMYDGIWEYWLLQCLRHGYDASFQWTYGGTQLVHTGTMGMGFRTWMGKRGLPCVVPMPRIHTEVPLTVVSFRMRVDPMPGAQRTSPEFLELVRDFRTRVSALLHRYPHDERSGQAPVWRISGENSVVARG